MASREHTAEPGRADPTRLVPRLYLVSPEVGDPAGLADGFAAALGAAAVAAVLLRLEASDDRTLINRIKALTTLVQGTGAALVVDGHPDLVARAGADGAHLTGIDTFNAARTALQPERIAGCGGLTTRHDAMLAGEASADYVLFGEPDSNGHCPAFDVVLDRVAWWAEVFEIPCVGFAATLADIDRLVAAGADFVAVGDCIFGDERGPAAAMADAARRLSPQVVA
jgi:thiamine-phosphate pyrophosphorylase